MARESEPPDTPADPPCNEEDESKERQHCVLEHGHFESVHDLGGVQQRVTAGVGWLKCGWVVEVWTGIIVSLSTGTLRACTTLAVCSSGFPRGWGG